MRFDKVTRATHRSWLAMVSVALGGLVPSWAEEPWPLLWDSSISKLVLINPYPRTGQIDDLYVQLRAIELFNPGTLGSIGKEVRSAATPSELSDRAGMNARLRDAAWRQVGSAIRELRLTENDRRLLATATSVRAADLQAPRVALRRRGSVEPPQPIGPGPCIDKETDCRPCPTPDGSAYCKKNQCVFGCKEKGNNCAEIDIDDPLAPYASTRKCGETDSPSDPGQLEIGVVW